MCTISFNKSQMKTGRIVYANLNIFLKKGDLLAICKGVQVYQIFLNHQSIRQNCHVSFVKYHVCTISDKS